MLVLRIMCPDWLLKLLSSLDSMVTLKMPDTNTGFWMATRIVDSTKRFNQCIHLNDIPFTGPGPRELTGAVDLISHYKLLPHYDFFCKRSLPVPIADTHYLHNVAGDTEIRKGEGMQLGQLIQNSSLSRETNTRIQPFDLDVLREAFQLRETALVDLPSVSFCILILQPTVNL
ncbi:hypothetical protein SASPL_124504 [Salvia splendens]|uniref:Uncharacterized protein n=1 Tax=Salvia splendens TaxID=180675 RepID=A0A8X8ZP87_SALSN|nr:hypothetical protein SASPL_124504 [Salvia splendens]